MPKIKTHSGAKKRIKITGSGKMLRRHAGRNHFLQKKQKSRKRAYTQSASIEGRAKLNMGRKLGI